MKSVLEETQLERDEELGPLIDIPLRYVQQLGICTPDSIRIYDGSAPIRNEEDYIDLYKDFKSLDFHAYLRTLMFTSVVRRGHYFKDTKHKDKTCLDYGSGVGTHTIVLLERGNYVDMMDINGPLLRFAHSRVLKRGYKTNILYSDAVLQDDHYDIVVCLDVLEHVYDPYSELVRLHKAMKKNAILILEVSLKVKESSGHFKNSIDVWESKGLAFLRKHFTRQSNTRWVKS